eukprot:comp17728_c0_seq1/m.17668 comp17728_c0_seq1/g.17668  ORF comp17728_c0_seq1/g.17668 comp17728_c0_seq1/m.17668 type:complete len:222 (-) comp17728_c0_seq1:443-1108(-)
MGDQIKWTTVVDMRPNQRSVNTHVIVLEKPKPQPTTLGLVYTLLVADQTGAIMLTVFNELGNEVRPGDILELVGGYCNLFKNKVLTLYVGQGDRGSLKRCGEFMMAYRDTPNMSDFRWEFLEPGNTFNMRPAPPINAVPPFLVPNMAGPGLVPYPNLPPGANPQGPPAGHRAPLNHNVPPMNAAQGQRPPGPMVDPSRARQLPNRNSRDGLFPTQRKPSDG